MERWLGTDEYGEAVSALEFVLQEASQLSRDVSRWRWIIIALHNALQGFMVIALRHSDGSGPVPQDIIDRILTANRTQQPQPPERLHKFLVLYRLIHSSRMDRFVNSKRFQPQPNHNKSVCQLNQLRNEFIHFTPKGWALEVVGLPQMCLSVIRFLMEESGNIFWSSSDLRQRAIIALTTSTTLFTALYDEYIAQA
jgi:hypothetical protein